jgi:hypothetical protein
VTPGGAFRAHSPDLEKSVEKCRKVSKFPGFGMAPLYHEAAGKPEGGARRIAGKRLERRDLAIFCKVVNNERFEV